MERGNSAQPSITFLGFKFIWLHFFSEIHCTQERERRWGMGRKRGRQREKQHEGERKRGTEREAERKKVKGIEVRK